MSDSCLKCTSLVFDIWAANFTKLVGIAPFASLWIDFVKTLANNVNLSPRTSVIHDDSLDMVVALLTLVLPSNNEAERSFEMTRLLIESWNVMNSICKFLPSDLKLMAPQLVSDITAIDMKK